MKKQIHKNQFENGQRFLGIDNFELLTFDFELLTFDFALAVTHAV